MTSFRSAFGHVVVVDVAHPAPLHSLHAEERLLCASWGERRKATFVAGRQALRAALCDAGVVGRDGDATSGLGAIGRDHRGAPVLPAGVAGSVTHKDTVAAALVDVGGQGHVGIDLEVEEGFDAVRLDKLALQVLTPRELADLPADVDKRRRAVLSRFSLKEALYKALDRYVGRYVGFLDVEVDVAAQGGATFVVDRVGAFVATGAIVDASLIPHPGIILTVARVVAASATSASPTADSPQKRR